MEIVSVLQVHTLSTEFARYVESIKFTTATSAFVSMATREHQPTKNAQETTFRHVDFTSIGIQRRTLANATLDMYGLQDNVNLSTHVTSILLGMGTNVSVSRVTLSTQRFKNVYKLHILLFVLFTARLTVYFAAATKDSTQYNKKHAANAPQDNIGMVHVVQ